MNEVDQDNDIIKCDDDLTLENEEDGDDEDMAVRNIVQLLGPFLGPLGSTMAAGRDAPQQVLTFSSHNCQVLQEKQEYPNTKYPTHQ